jgi:hypothetical protein
MKCNNPQTEPHAQWAAAQSPPSQIGPIDRNSSLSGLSGLDRDRGPLTAALGPDDDDRSDAQTSVSRRFRPRAPPASPANDAQDVPDDVDERSVRDTVWL